MMTRVIVCFLLLCVHHAEGGNFLGAALSYNFIDNNTAEVEVLTSWVLGHGLCGAGCNRTDIGPLFIPPGSNLSTKYPDYGLFYTSRHHANPELWNYDNSINLSVDIIDVSETASWEQDMMKFTIDLNDSQTLIEYTGEYWKDFGNQGQQLPWRLANAVHQGVRNDTRKPNSSPKVWLRPYYRARWNVTTYIYIPTIDDDGDVVKCSKGMYVDAGQLMSSPGVTVHENCTVQIDALESLGYINNTWMGLDILLRDYNTDTVHIDADIYQPIKMSIARSNVQFAVHIMDDVASPIFIEPTQPNGQEYVVYIGSNWNAHMCAEGSGTNDIANFVTTSRDTMVTQSALQPGKDRNRMKCVDLSWTPNTADIGPHIICTSAVDTSGMISDEIRCYTVQVKGKMFNNTVHKSQTRPYFVDFPGYGDLVQCIIHTVCVLPVLVKSQTKLTSISVVEHYTNMAHTTYVATTSRNGELLYQADVSFEDKGQGIKEVCLIATDENGISSDKTCFNVEILPQDPCYSSPCRNSASCKMVDTSGAFICECLPSFSGKLCEHFSNPCDANPCDHGKCYYVRHQMLCFCDQGFTGKYCETNINECDVTGCNGHGACQDKINAYECDCMERYTGSQCQTDMCPSHPGDQHTCTQQVGCDPNPCIHGQCTTGPNCTCMAGYDGAFCDTAIGIQHNSSVVEFIPPTPPNGSQLICYKHNGSLVPCQLMVYVRSEHSFNLNTDSSPGIVALWKLEPMTQLTNKSGNIYNVLVTLQGIASSSSLQYVCLTIHQTGLEDFDVCYSIGILPDPMETETTLQSLQQNATWRFLDPTLNDGSQVRCLVGEACRIMLYTNSNKGVCKQIIPASSARSLTIFPPIINNDTGICSSEVDIKLPNGTDTTMCFLSSVTDNQQLCLKIEEVSPLQNPCVSNTCQHEGRCFHDKSYTYHCVCKPGYDGDNCETGPCLPTADDCKNGGYCLSHNGTSTCICKTGYLGPKCETPTGKLSQTSVPIFYGSATPTTIECVVNHPYRFSQQIASPIPGPYTPHVVNGYLSAGLTVNTNVVQFNHSYEAEIMLLAERSGLYDVCIQIEANQSITYDELCFKVKAVTDPFTLYAYKDRPHFVGFSLPTESKLECVVGESCHVFYHVTAGQGNDNDCNDVQLNHQIDDFPTYHVFSTCGTCSTRGIVNSACTVDVSIATDKTDVGAVHKFNVLARLRESGLEGEQRNFTLAIISDTILTARTGCETLQCLNNGFCDGHVPNFPRCYCKQGFSGFYCQQATIPAKFAVDQKQSFFGDIAIPSEVECKAGTTSSIPFQIIRNMTNGNTAKLKFELGYVDDDIKVSGPFVDTLNNVEYIGYVKVNCTTYGKHNVCLQTGSNGITEDELCVAVNVVGTMTRSITDTDKLYPYYLNPTLPDESLVLCEFNQSCHVVIHYTTGEQFGFNGTCPTVTETNAHLLKGIHIFEPTIHSHYCDVDIVYVPTVANVTNKLCLQVSLPGKPGETRCLSVKVVDNVYEEVPSPCRRHICGNETRFKCSANLTVSPPTAECVCQFGYVGPNCEEAPPCSKVCINGGYCSQDVCYCVDGYGGEHCEIVFDPCASGPCERGLCFHHQTSFHCVCPPGYDGQTCHIDVDECLVRPCYNGGSCVDGINNYTCKCLDGFTGQRCHLNVDECSSNPCLHGGTCHDEIDQYSCRCPPEYQGKRCETEVNPCDSSPCVHGRCFHHLLDYHCVCQEGYTGASCQTDIDECASNPCSNGALCIDEIDRFICNCSAGYNGINCETDINECASSPCLNGGFCHDELDQFTCHCPSGYDGVVCEKIVDPCIPNPCQPGICYSSGQQIYCDCPKGYYGQFCENHLGVQLLGPKDLTLDVSTGSEINLNCTVSSNKPVTFSWNKVTLCEDLNNDTDGSVLLVSRNATLGDSGTYVCTASDQGNPAITKYFNVHVDVSGFSETCNFDDGLLCDWKLNGNGGMNWVFNNGNHSTIDGAMLYDHTTGSSVGNYLYTETTPNRKTGDQATLTSSIMPAKQTLCVQFWYYLSGNDVGEIVVTLEDTCLKTETRVFFESGNQGNSWHKASSTIIPHRVPNDYRILIKADIGAVNDGDVAIDDLTISGGQCKDQPDPSFIG